MRSSVVGEMAAGETRLTHRKGKIQRNDAPARRMYPAGQEFKNAALV
jgi:hypothetical protein